MEGKVTITGFLAAEELALLLAAADAVVSFPQWKRHWNSSIHAAMAQEASCVTSTETHGYSREQNAYYALENTERCGALSAYRAPERTDEKASDWPRLQSPISS
jgi:hypothetical protein